MLQGCYFSGGIYRYRFASTCWYKDEYSQCFNCSKSFRRSRFRRCFAQFNVEGVFIGENKRRRARDVPLFNRLRMAILCDLSQLRVWQQANRLVITDGLGWYSRELCEFLNEHGHAPVLHLPVTGMSSTSIMRCQADVQNNFRLKSSEWCRKVPKWQFRKWYTKSFPPHVSTVRSNSGLQFQRALQGWNKWLILWLPALDSNGFSLKSKWCLWW